MDITERYTTRNGRQFLIRLSYNERIQDSDNATAFVRDIEVIDSANGERLPLPVTTAKFSTYENFASFGGYTAVNYFGVRETAIEALRTKVLTRVEDYLESLG
jgi:hypothetical protein